MSYLDEDHDRFVNGDPGSLDPGAFILLLVLAIGGVYWWMS